MDDEYNRVLADLTSVEPSRLAPFGGNDNSSEPPSSLPQPVQNSDVNATQHPSGIVPKLQNIVATCSLGCALDLKRIAQHARNAEYNPKRFAAVIMRIRDPKTTALIFSSGKMVCTGAKSEQESRLASRKFAKIVMKIGYSVTFQDFKIQNIVGSCDVMFHIRLEQLNFKHSLFTRYEPELFPGLVYKMKSPKVVLLIFVSGKVVLTGAKKRTEIFQAFENIYPTLTEFRKSKRKPIQEASQEPQEDPTQRQITSPSVVNYSHSLRSDERYDNRYSPLPPGQYIPDECPSIQMSFNSDHHSVVFPDSFHSQFSPYGLIAGADSGHQIQQSPSTSPFTSCPSSTPLVHLIRPPTPQSRPGQ